GEELGVAVQRRLGAREVRIAELFGLFLDLLGELGVHIADAKSDEVMRQFLQQIHALELRLDLLGESRLVDHFWLVRLCRLLFDAGDHLVPLGLDVFRHVSRRELLLLRKGVHESEAMLARKLPAWTVAAMRRLFRPQKITGTAIRFLPAPLAFAKQD